MNKNEALKLLELTGNPSIDEIRKQFRKVVAPYHTDRNKDPNAEATFKKINEAYQYLVNGPPESEFKVNRPPWAQSWQTHVDSGPIRKPFHAQDVRIPLHLTFIEAVKGCKKKVSYKRWEECSHCEGTGGKANDDKCESCNGKGSTPHSTNFGNATFTVMSICPVCQGSGKGFIKCEPCDGVAAVQVDKNLDVNIPGAIQDQQVIRLSGQGNWSYVPPSFQGFGDAFLMTRVQKNDNMILSGLDIVSKVDINLLTALKGGKIDVQSLLSNVELDIPPKTKHLDKLSIPDLGAEAHGKKGSHIFEVNVNYPENVLNIVELLEKE